MEQTSGVLPPSSNHDARFQEAMLSPTGRFPRICLALAEIVRLLRAVSVARAPIGAASAQPALIDNTMVRSECFLREGEVIRELSPMSFCNSRDGKTFHDCRVALSVQNRTLLTLSLRTGLLTNRRVLLILSFSYSGR
jgi:hypothetical protein